ncbi:unnamed protein product [Phytophthora fragariaefolia]|uniref:RxLR effector protein n=1 Tax=Phytophthora fragariaefolia TaxID=1490495 RepID=A0A9W6X5D1_9STRA|nr:unnamed protein product [Phytophthora fragariaefolia]
MNALNHVDILGYAAPSTCSPHALYWELLLSYRSARESHSTIYSTDNHSTLRYSALLRMRLAYFLAVVVAATLHASGTAFVTTKNSNDAAITNVAAADLIHSFEATKDNGGRMLRKTKENAVSKEERLEEERSSANWWLSVKHRFAPLKRFIPMTEEYKMRNKIKNRVSNGRRRARNRENFDASIIP